MIFSLDLTVDWGDFAQSAFIKLSNSDFTINAFHMKYVGGDGYFWLFFGGNFSIIAVSG